LSSVGATTDAPAAIVVTNLMGAWGEALFDNPQARFGGLGQREPEEGRRAFVRGRTYDTSLGRFEQVDPYPVGLTSSLYVYSSLRPTGARDPLGLFTIEVLEPHSGAQIAPRGHEALTEEATFGISGVNFLGRTAHGNMVVENIRVDWPLHVSASRLREYHDRDAIQHEHFLRRTTDPPGMAGNLLAAARAVQHLRSLADQALEWAVRDTNQGRLEAYVLLGRALHGIEDSYSHTTRTGDAALGSIEEVYLYVAGAGNGAIAHSRDKDRILNSASRLTVVARSAIESDVSFLGAFNAELVDRLRLAGRAEEEIEDVMRRFAWGGEPQQAELSRWASRLRHIPADIVPMRGGMFDTLSEYFDSTFGLNVLPAPDFGFGPAGPRP
jgi:RHS repeat-associated protein